MPIGLSQYLMIGKLVALLAAIALICFQSSQIHRWHTHFDAERAAHVHDNVAFAQTVFGYRVAAEQAKQADKANADRVVAEQRSINERTSNDYEARLADARALAQRLRAQAAAAGGHPGSGTGAPVPGVPATPIGPAQAACDRLPDGSLVDLKLCATEQGIQLDALIQWVRAQAGVEVNGQTGSNPAPGARSEQKPGPDLQR